MHQTGELWKLASLAFCLIRPQVNVALASNYRSMRITRSRFLILAAVALLVAVMVPGLREYLTVERCLGSASLYDSGVVVCSDGVEKLSVSEVHWFQIPTVASEITGLLAAGFVILVFTFRDRARARLAG